MPNTGHLEKVYLDKPLASSMAYQLQNLYLSYTFLILMSTETHAWSYNKVHYYSTSHVLHPQRDGRSHALALHHTQEWYIHRCCHHNYQKKRFAFHQEKIWD